MLSKLVSFSDDPFVELYDRPLKGQVPYVFNRQPGTPVLAETASVGQQSG
jgi:hypothetical protein